MTKVAILGGGSWGTALAIILSRSRRAHGISMWVHDAALSESIRCSRENATYLPGHKLPTAVHVTHEMQDALANVNIVIGAMPSAHARAVYTQALPHLASNTTLVSATKGLEPSTHLRMSEVITETVSPKFSPRVAVLSGPSFAAEAARGEPTAVVLASQDAALASELQEQFAAPGFRLYTSDDVLGVELAGAMKNVIALAAGACQGLGLGANSLAALITRGLAEMTRLGVARGARPETLSGLAGLGDLVLTCTGALSRNRHVGIELGKGRPLTEILAGMRMVAEGVGTASALLALAREGGIELPITEQVDAILSHAKSPRQAIRDIMERPLRRE
ncbi:MAG TPA: NAD(P)H-dependent glycerol-3-phosphate dehydrogenase [Candidatus Acidoferrum sp.]|nr:NAD(P)H-dependent glycerol-3-phosphate dehydrogenase [Candidatus Acidoferrum sp.]